MCASKDQANGDVPEQSRVDPEIDQEWEARRARFHNVSSSLLHQRTSEAARPVLPMPLSPISGPVHEQVGYKEGLEEGKAKTLQQGFDEGEDQTFCFSDAHKLQRSGQAHGIPALFTLESPTSSTRSTLLPII